MKKILFFVAGLLSIQTYAQTSDDINHTGKHKFLISANFGVSWPTAGYGSKDSVPLSDTTHLHGYASPGFYFNVTAGYMFTDVVGAKIMFSGNYGVFNTVAYESAYDGINNPFAYGTVTASGNYFIGQYLVGPYFRFHILSNKFNAVGVEALAGPTVASYPTITSDDGYSMSVKGGNGFSYRIGISYEIYTSDNLFFSVTVGYSGGSINYPSVTYTEAATQYTPATSYTSNSTRSMTFGAAQVSTGVTFLL